MTTTLDIPAGPHTLSADWLTAALRQSGAVRDANVTSVKSSIIGEGAGFMGQLAKLSLQYDKPEDGAPKALIAKFPAAAQENRDVAMFFRFYERETGFYREIADRVELRTPRCYFNAFDPSNGDFALLLGTSRRRAWATSSPAAAWRRRRWRSVSWRSSRRLGGTAPRWRSWTGCP